MTASLSGQYVVTLVIAAAILAYVIFQQLRTRLVNPRRLVTLPGIMILLGIFNLDKHPPTSGAAFLAIVASLLVAVVFGLARGVSVQTWREGGAVFRKGTAVTLILWIVGLALRVLIGFVAAKNGVNQAVTYGEAPLFFGVTLAAQNVLIWYRAEEQGGTVR